MLKEALLNAQNRTYTENGAVTYATSRSDILDLFALGAAAKGDVSTLIENALDEDFDLGLRAILYLSDIREGQGRRDFFKSALKIVLRRDKEKARKLLAYIPEFGRWDYLYWFMGTSLERDALNLMRLEVVSAITNERPSLVFKWMASEDASSVETKRNAEITRKYFGMPKKNYRKLLSEGRRIADIVERKMSTGEWELIKYETVPSVAMKKYRKAFENHSVKKFEQFLNKVETGEAKINASVIYPVDVLRAGLSSSDLSYRASLAQWNALPNYVAQGLRVMPVVDTSGSMGGTGHAMGIAGSLGIYLAEKLEGTFKNCVMSFSAEAKLFDLNGKGDAFQKYEYLRRNSINENTNLQSVFTLLLNTATKNRIPADQMPNRIVIMSDMEFDQATGTGYWSRTRNEITNLDAIRSKYAASGYEFPQIIFWNVEACTKQTPATMNDQGIIMVSGYSPVILKAVLSDEPYVTPYKAMLNTLMVKRYDIVNEL